MGSTVVDSPRIEFRGVSKRYPGVQALDNVSFAVAPGSVHAIVGENGAGKSTLMKVLAGATGADSGTICLDGEEVQIRNARHSQSLGIAVVHQEFNLAGDLSVAENVFLDRWPRGPLGLISFGKLRTRSQALFQSLGIEINVRRKVRDLVVAQQQMVEIARALSLQARVLVLDEPSAVLTPNELSALFETVRKLARQGVSVLYISHRLDEVFSLGDTVTVLRDGRHISTRPLPRTGRETLIQDMVGRPITEEFPRRDFAPGGIALRVEGLCSGRRFHDVSFDVRSGEVFAITGLVGSGRSSVGKALFGAVPVTSGRLLVGGSPARLTSPRRAQRAGVAYLPEDRKQQGLLLGRPMYENVTLAHLPDVSSRGFLRIGEERRISRRRIAELRIKAPTERVPVGTLSGGNQQKVMIARWLQRAYRVIVLDEPTRGVDVGAKVEIYGLINAMAKGGAAVLMITSELPEAIGMADRIGVMCHGRLAGVLDNRGHDVSQEGLLRLAVGEGGGASL